MPSKAKNAIVFIHGLARKPSPEKLAELWLEGLGRDNPMPTVFAPPNAGVQLDLEGTDAFFNYYADVFYGEDYETDFRAYREREGLEIATEEALDDMAPNAGPTTPREIAFVASFEAKLAAQAVLTPAPGPAPASAGPGDAQFEIAAWLPAPLKRGIIKKAAMEAFYFLFDKEYTRPDGASFRVRKELRDRLLAELHKASAAADRVIVVSHSMGTIVAYDVLRNCPDCPPVDTLITLGSPLGLQEVQDELKAAGAKRVDFPADRLAHWVNVYDPLDPICGADPKLGNDYAPVGSKQVEDIRESNWGKWRHTITHYFAGTLFRARLLQALKA
jgi:hypothetical protein